MNNIRSLFSMAVLRKCYAHKRRDAEAAIAAAFFSTFGVGAFTFALSLGAHSSGVSAAWLGLAFSAYFFARLVLAPIAGYAADFIGARPLLLGASGVGAAVPFLYLLYPSVETLGVIQICLGFCSGIIKPVSMGLLGDCVPESSRGRLFGAYNTFMYSALVLSPLAGGAAVEMQGRIGELSLICPILGMFFSFISFARGRMGGGVVRGEKDTALGLPWREPLFAALLLAVLGRTAGASVVITFMPRLISESFGLEGMQAGLLFALPSLVLIAITPVTGKWADQLDRSGLTFLGMGICAACLFGYGQVSSIWTLGLLAACMGLGSALSLPASMSLAADMGRGRVMGIFLGVSNLGFVLGPVLAGFAAEAGGMPDVFELTALFSGLCLLPVFLVMSRKLHVS
ncbi:MFS transporter [Maridesulfovibrio sp.]|uniref:MFS transporter n=1 Tax=Maridesulfovibrio sp. TaxID=2795000 RepID=UPI0029F539A8|nr:MFS transporter [Maridesulfovibrio sp.]